MCKSADDFASSCFAKGKLKLGGRYPSKMCVFSKRARLHAHHQNMCVGCLCLQGELRWFLALSIFWALYNMIPPSLFLFYLFKSDGIFEDYCSLCFVTSFLLGIGGIVCTWLVPDDYNLGQVRIVHACYCHQLLSRDLAVVTMVRSDLLHAGASVERKESARCTPEPPYHAEPCAFAGAERVHAVLRSPALRSVASHIQRALERQQCDLRLCADGWQ